MPELLIQGGNGGGSSIDGLLGLQILDKMGKSVAPQTHEVVAEEVKPEDKTSKKK